MSEDIIQERHFVPPVRINLAYSSPQFVFIQKANAASATSILQPAFMVQVARATVAAKSQTGAVRENKHNVRLDYKT